MGRRLPVSQQLRIPWPQALRMALLPRELTSLELIVRSHSYELSPWTRKSSPDPSWYLASEFQDKLYCRAVSLPEREPSIPSHHEFWHQHRPQDILLAFQLRYSDKNDASTWMWQFTYSFPTQNADKVIAMTHEQWLNMLREGSEKWIDPWKSALKWLPDGTEIPADKVNLWNNITRWDNHEGRVTLAGDAAHAMPPCKSKFLLNLSPKNWHQQIADKVSTTQYRMQQTMLLLWRRSGTGKIRRRL